MLLAAVLGLQSPAAAAAAAGDPAVCREKEQSDSSYGQTGRTGTERAEETELRVLIQDAGQKKQDAVTVHGLRITAAEGTEEISDRIGKSEENSGPDSTPGLKEGYSGQVPAGGETVSVVSEEGERWEIPLFWMDDSNRLVEKSEKDGLYKPVLAFFVPEDYVVRKDAENGFTVTLDPRLSSLYEAAGGAVCLYDPHTNITYILAAGADLSFLQGEAEKMPARPIPGLPGELQKPGDGTYRNPSAKKEPSLSGEESRDRSSEDENREIGRQADLTGIGQGENGGKTDRGENEEPPADTSQDDSGESRGETQEREDLPQNDGTEGPGEAEKPIETEEQEQKAEDAPLTREQLLAHCAKNTLDTYGEDEMANLVDLIINRIQPQAVNLIKDKFPAFARAAQEDALGKEMGLYIYRMYGEEDGVKAHQDTSTKALAYVGYRINEDEEGQAELGYVIGVNTIYFQSRDKDRKLHIDTSEQAVADLDNSILHEMFHAFMCDYNRTGTIGTPDPDDYLQSGKELQKTRELYEFPDWFKEGIASAVENVYQYRYEYFQLLRYEGEGTIGGRHTADNLLNAYLTRLFLLEDEEEYEDSYDIGAAERTSTSTYVTGYLADLYLGELAARSENTSSVSEDENGNKTVSSESIRLGLNSILARLHRGETLDEIVRHISNGRYQDVRDFEQKFIKGTDQKGDQDSLLFCVDFLNYMQDIGAKNTYLPNGSILFGFDRDFDTPIDRSANVTADFYRIRESSDYTPSTVGLETPYRDGGKSRPEEAARPDRTVSAGGESLPSAAKEENSLKEKENPVKEEDSLEERENPVTEENSMVEKGENPVKEEDSLKDKEEYPDPADETIHGVEDRNAAEPAAAEPEVSVSEEVLYESVLEAPAGGEDLTDSRLEAPAGGEVLSDSMLQECTGGETVPVEEEKSTSCDSGQFPAGS